MSNNNEFVELIITLGARIRGLELDLKLKTCECEDLTKQLSEMTAKLVKAEEDLKKW